MNKLRLLLLLLVTFWLPVSPAAEYIESFHADIEIQKNGDLLVTEIISVFAEGKKIKRGIYRDFPTRYRGSDGSDHSVGFELLSVTRDHSDEPFHTKKQSNGIRIYIGDANVFLKPGIYTYQIRYRTDRQLGYFDDHDELYWNVTGNGWDFEIRRASARVTLPEAATNLVLTGYTGKQGSEEQALDFGRDGKNRAWFQSARKLRPREGLTIVAGWEKGLVEQPSDDQIRAWFVADHKGSIIVAGAIIAVLFYYLLLWHWFGRDPKAGVIVPRYRPPAGYSPASMRFIKNMWYDKACFTTAVINLAVKGELEINERGGDYVLVKTGPAGQPLAAGEQAVLFGLFAGSDTIEIEQANHRTLSSAIDNHRASLKRDYQKKYFNSNSWYLLPAILVSFGLLVLAVMGLPSEDLIAKTLLITAFTLVPVAGAYSSLYQIFHRRKRGLFGIISMVGPIAFVVFLFWFIGPLMVDLAKDVPLVISVGAVVLLALHFLFYQLLKAPTLAGRRLLDQIEGFEHYLRVAEEDELALAGAPKFTAEIYETYLPYAIALDLENEWSAKLDRAIAYGSIRSDYDSPRWYRSYHEGGRGFSTALATSFNSAIASSSVAPGSSSGSSGGSSGGGGGGGGGGGW